MKIEKNTDRNYYKGDDDMINNMIKDQINWERKQTKQLGLSDTSFNKVHNQKRSRNLGYTYENKQLRKYGMKNYINSLNDTGYDDFAA